MISNTPVESAITFEAAIAKTQDLLEQIAQAQISPEQAGAEIADLVKSQNGARGFFVTYLTDERPFADQADPAVVAALATSPETVAELLVKNLVMSTAMIIAHRRNQDEPNAQGSEQVQQRTAALISALQNPLLAEKIADLYHSLQTGAGDYATFLDRWGYDPEQRAAMAAALEPWVAAA